MKSKKKILLIVVVLAFIIALIPSIFFACLLIPGKVRTFNLNNNKHVLFIAVDGYGSKYINSSHDLSKLEAHSIYTRNGRRMKWPLTDLSFRSLLQGKEITSLEIKYRIKSEKNIFREVQASGGKTAAFISFYKPMLNKVASKTHKESFGLGIHKDVATSDTQAVDAGMKYFLKNKPSLEMIYLAGLDEMAHLHKGSSSSQYQNYIKTINKHILNIISQVTDPNTLVIISTDHGWPKKGLNHAGQTLEEVTVPIWEHNVNYKSKKLPDEYNITSIKGDIVNWLKK